MRYVWSKMLADGGHKVERQTPISFSFRGEHVAIAFRADIVVDDSLLIEVKALKELHPVHFSQTRTYLRLGNIPVGLLLNFGAEHLKDGYERLVNPRFAFVPPSRRKDLVASGTLGSSGTSGVPGGPEPSSR